MSRIVIVGGTGYAGASIAKEAAARGHEVVAISRSAPTDPVPDVEYVSAPAGEAGSVIAGADVVVGALSPRGDTAGTLVDVYATVGRRAADAGARLIVIGGFGSLRPAAGAPRFAESGGLPPEFAAEAGEMNDVRAALELTPEALDWLFASPAAAYGADAPQAEPRGTYRTGTEVALFDDAGGSAISGADFALAVVDEIEKPTHRRGQVHFAN